MNGARTTVILLLFGAAAGGCGSSGRMQESYARLNAYGEASQESVLQEVGALPFKKQKWTHRWADYPIRRISIGRENLFIETPDNKVLAVDRFYGLTKWIFEIPTRAPLDYLPTEPGEVFEQIRGYEEQLRAQERVLQDLLKAEGPGAKSLEAQREKNRIFQLLLAAQRGDNVYLISRQMLYCIARQTGKLLWQRALPFAPSARAFATRESVYIPAADRTQVWRLDVEKRGESVQNFPADVGSGDRTIQNPPIVDSSHLYFVSADGRCYCYDVNAVEKKWTFPALDKLTADPLLHKVQEKYKDSTGKESIRTRRYLLCGGLDYAVYCIDPNDGSLTWKYETGGFLRSPIVVKDQTVYVKSDDGALFAMELNPQHKNAKTGAPEGPWRGGQLRWKIPLGERFLVKGSEDRVLVLGPNSEIYQMNDLTGDIVGRFPLVEIGHVLTNPWDPILYVATDSGFVFALEESGSQY
ncbi:MAG TPA: PQQ-binding-like beta-propeller repeat protein [Planctomycetota bacterium]|nr:PQQ-binding-like beta-propeller repeat protein [Planctomycetota bacterium]